MNGNVNDWYSGRSILVTGGSGYMGKVLLEKLIRSLPGIEKVYVLIRSKHGQSASGRLLQMTKVPVFDKIRKENPEGLQKLIAVDGDISSEGMGLSEASMELLKREVTVVFHAAANVRFETTLKDAINNNTISTDRVMRTCVQLPRLEVFCHLSTACCHSDIDVLEERIYPAPHDYKDVLRTLELLDEESIQHITPKIVAPHPNPYAYSKRLAESIVYDYGKRMPILIVRPSLVLPAMKEPIPGWVDSLNGPIGLLVAGGKGVCRTMLGDPGHHAEIIPVDIATNAIIVSTWQRGIKHFDDVPIYNLTQGDVHTITWEEVIERGRKLITEYPLDWPIWYPDGAMRTNPFTHQLSIIFFHLLPAYIIDFILLILMQKRFMVKTQARITGGLKLFQSFTKREWKYKNSNFLTLTDELNENDKKTFYMCELGFNVDEYYKDMILGTKQYCLKEDMANLPRARLYMKFLYLLHTTVKILFYYYLAYFFFSCFGYGYLLDRHYWSSRYEVSH